MYVDCDPGTASAPELKKIASGPGRGAYYLPVTGRARRSTSTSSRTSTRSRCAAARDHPQRARHRSGGARVGSERGDPPRRSGPRQHRPGAEDPGRARTARWPSSRPTRGRARLRSRASERRSLTSSSRRIRPPSERRARRRHIEVDPAASRLPAPAAAADVRPRVARRSGDASRRDLGQSAAALGREFQELTPFATTARTSLIDLGEPPRSRKRRSWRRSRSRSG